MDESQGNRGITLGASDNGWFTRTDDGVAVWHPSRDSAFQTATDWARRHRPARAMLWVAGELVLLFAIP